MQIETQIPKFDLSFAFSHESTNYEANISFLDFESSLTFSLSLPENNLHVNLHEWEIKTDSVEV